MDEASYMAASAKSWTLSTNFNSWKSAEKDKNIELKEQRMFESLNISQRLLCHLYLLKSTLEREGWAKRNAFTISWLTENQELKTRHLLRTTHQTGILIIPGFPLWGNKSTDIDLKVPSLESWRHFTLFSLMLKRKEGKSRNPDRVSSGLHMN